MVWLLLVTLFYGIIGQSQSIESQSAVKQILVIQGEEQEVKKIIEVQGHRGARSVLPENTLAAFEYAMQVGVDTLEFDLGVTADEVVVVSHDQKINQTICQYLDGSQIEHSKWLHEMTLDEVRAIDCGAKPNPRFPAQKLQPQSQIPTLDEVFQLVADSSLENAKNILFNIETKSDPEHPHAQPEPKRFVELILASVDKYNVGDRVTIQSFDHRTLRAAKRLDSTIQLSALFESAPNDWVAATKEAKADIVSPYYKVIDKDSVSIMQAAGLRVIPWTANTEESWQHLIDIGVDGIISDDPEPLIKFLSNQPTNQ